MKSKLSILIIGCLLLCSNNLKSQDFLDSVAIATCECMNNIDSADLVNGLEIQAGFCMLESMNPYKTQFMAYLGIKEIDFGDDDLMHKMGEVIGLKMVNHCPIMLMKLAGAGTEEGVEEVVPTKTIKAKVKKVETNQFITFTVIDENEKRHKLVWLIDFPGSDELIDNYEKLKNKNCQFDYEEVDLFDPRIKEYHTFKMITGFKLK